jgi:ubiquinone/menaquinone biosynthesis C-methylase UbiE
MTPGKRVDYDRIASSYDVRFRKDGMSGTASALLALARELDAERILEVGCGTGRWLADLRAITDQVFGLDLAAGMLTKARERENRVLLMRGRASHLPIPAASFDLVYCVNAIHHFDKQRAFVFEARRCLRPGGALAVVGMDPHGCRDQYYVYHYFEGVYETDLARFPSWGTVLDWMAAAGLERVTWEPILRIYDPKLGRAVFEDPFLLKDATSQLTLLTNEAYAAGLRRMQAAVEAAEVTGEGLLFPVDIPIGMLVGRLKPESVDVDSNS